MADAITRSAKRYSKSTFLFQGAHARLLFKEGGSVIGLLRAIRGWIGLLIVLQPFGLIIQLLWLLPNSGEAAGYGMGSIVYRLALLLVSIGLFLGLRRVINRMYLKKHGVPHPTLAQRPWAL